VADFKYIGKDYQTSDIVAKVTGRAKYAEDYRADGMLFCKLMLSPMPHARIRSIDTSEAMKLEGVVAIITGEDMPVPPAAPRPQGAPEPPPGPPIETALAKEPSYEGEPILAVAAVDELTAAEAIERIRIDFEPLPFVIDPIDSLRPNGPNAREQGNIFAQGGLKTHKWTAADVATFDAGKFPMGADPGTDISEYGNVDEAFKTADLVLEETWSLPTTPHLPLETRSAMAMWDGTKLRLYGSTQSLSRTVQPLARWAGIEEKDLTLICEYCGGGFGSKIPGAPSMAIPAILSKKAGGRPVMMRLSREEETYLGRVRPGFQAGVKAGFRKDGRMVALDMYIIQPSGPYTQQGDANTAGTVSSLLYTPENFRIRTISVCTNTPPPTSQRAPGGLQAMQMLEPMVAKAARKLGVDQVAIRKVNAPVTNSLYGTSDKPRPRQPVTGAFLKEALDLGAEKFNWEERKKVSGQRRGTKVRGVGVGAATFSAGAIGFDGLAIIRPEDGKVIIHSGIGNLGTHSVMDTSRWFAEVLDTPWEQFEVVWGSTDKHVANSCVQAGSSTAHAHSRTSMLAAQDMKKKLQEIAAKDLGGSPDGYDVGNGRVFRKGNPGGGLSFAQAAKRAVDLGGKFDGHELPDNINAMTKDSATALSGKGLIGVANDNYGRKGGTMSFAVGFLEVEVDVETGVYEIIDYVGSVDVGTVLHPRALGGQIHGGAVQGFGGVRSQRLAYDKHYGAALGNRLYNNKPPTILDIPHKEAMQWYAPEIPDPQSPPGSKGIGEASVGAGSAALMCALADAVGDDIIRRLPAHPESIMTAIETGAPAHHPLKAFI
jgi:CO/xanthine dehydrogenase Mo-binding subunit